MFILTFITLAAGLIALKFIGYCVTSMTSGQLC